MAKVKFTVLGGTGFIGGHLVRHLQAQGHEVWAPGRGAAIEPGTPAGHVIYTIGLTGDFRKRLFDTIDAHVTVLTRLLRTLSFDSWLYLSSTRVYGGLGTNALASETARLNIAPSADAVYDLSKLLGEAICLAQPQATVRVARVSNVYGPGHSPSMFLGLLLSEATRTGRVTIGEAPQSSKDYISVDAVVRMLERIALEGKDRLYNVASGTPTTHQALADKISQVTGAKMEFAPNAPVRIFPRIDASRVKNEFSYAPPSLLDDVGALVKLYTRNTEQAR